MKFGCIVAVWTCRLCAKTIKRSSPTISVFELGTALVLAIFWCIVLWRSPEGLSWWDAFIALLGQVCLLFVPGALTLPFAVLFEPGKCRACGGLVFFAGRYISSQPNLGWEHGYAAIVVVAINVSAWVWLWP